MIFSQLRQRLRRRSRHAAAPAAPVTVVDLGVWNRDAEGVVTPINRPDSLRPIDHPIPAVDPDVADTRLEVTQLIAELNARGSLDEGTYDVLDYWVNSRVAGWLALVDQQATERERIAARLMAVDIENLQHQAATLLGQRREFDEATDAYAFWRDVAHGHDVPAPVTPTRPNIDTAPAAPELPLGFPGSRLAGLWDESRTPAACQIRSRDPHGRDPSCVREDTYDLRPARST